MRAETFVALVLAIAIGEYLGFKLNLLEKAVKGYHNRWQLRRRYHEYERKRYVVMEEQLAAAPDKLRDRGLVPPEFDQALSQVKVELQRQVDEDLHAYKHIAGMPCGRTE